METAEKTEKCAHVPCKCTAQMPGEYCSEHCKEAVGGVETECHCGHPECG